MTGKDLNKDVARVLKSELALRGITYQKLSELLNDADIPITKASIDSKISRGSFSASFFVQCLKVIGCTNLDLKKLDFMAETTTKQNEQ
jgi:hypothetical protein